MTQKLPIYLFFSFIVLIGCKEETIEPDDEIIEEENPEEEEEPIERIDLFPEDTRDYMVDPNATAETVALFYNLKEISYNRFVVGQQDAFSRFYNDNAGISDMKKTTGSDPGLLGSDFMFITDDQNTEEPDNWFYQQELDIIEKAVSAYDKGMVNAFSWHFREPYEGEHFYSSEIPFENLYNAFKSLLPGRENHDYYKQKLEKVAEIANSVVGADGTLSPIIFRPFHEFDKDFFWWGAAYSTPEEFKELWQFTVTYLRDELNVHNLLYAFSPDNSYATKEAYLERYPGDAYVDIIGMDNYGDLLAQDGSGVEAANQKLKVVSNLSLERVKVAAFTETGYFIDNNNASFPDNFFSNNLYKTLTDNDIEVGYMMFWSNGPNSYTVPTPGAHGESDFLAFTEKEEIILLENMPSIYTLPVQ